MKSKFQKLFATAQQAAFIVEKVFEDNLPMNIEVGERVDDLIAVLIEYEDPVLLKELLDDAIEITNNI